MSFLYKDDRTGRFSGTTLRTWLLFILFYTHAVLLVVTPLMGFGEFSEISLELLHSLGIFSMGGGALYLGKRVQEGRGREGHPHLPKEDL